MSADDEVNDDLPEGWAISTLKEITRRQKGKKPTGLQDHKSEGLVPYLDIKAFELRTFRKYAPPKDSVLVKGGTPLVVWDGARSGLSGFAPCNGALGSTLSAVTSDVLDSGLLHYFLAFVYGTLNGQTRGTGIPHVDPNVFDEIVTPLPPLAEQRRIVAKVEALLARVQTARQRLARVPQILKRFRQAVLTAACDGRLTAEWREKFGAGKDLLTEVESLTNRRKIDWEQFVMTRYKPPDEFDPASDLEPPDGWAAVSMDSLTSLITSGSRAWSKYYGSGTGTFIMAQNVRPYKLDLSTRQQVDPPENNRDRVRSQVRKGDLLVTIVGANTGHVCPIDEDLPEHYVCQSVAIMRPVEPRHAPYLNLYLNSESHGRGEYKRYTYGEGRPHLGFDQIRVTKILLPTLCEQREIVRRVDALFKLADAIERRVVVATARADKLTQAILAKAFHGELVPTEAELARQEGREYETAAELLARIQTQRANAPEAKTKRKKARA